MSKYQELLVNLADELDREGNPELADEIDKNFEEFLKLLENGELDFSYLYYGKRDPRGPYSTNRGRETPAYGIPGPQ